MPAYDIRLSDPPAPIAFVVLRNLDNGFEAREVPMLLDTGASVSLVPVKALEVLQLVISTDQAYELTAWDGNKSYSYAVRLQLLLLNKSFKGQFLVVDSEYGIIGRDILNLLTLMFDGPRLTWQEIKRTIR